MFVLLFALASVAHASPGGKTGVAASGCSCHGRESSKTTATLEADTTEVEVGGVVNLTMTVAHSTDEESGLDVAAKTGALAAGSNTQLYKQEITHKSPTAMGGGATVFEFSWTADTPGDTRIYGVGLAADGDGKEDGDAWAFADDVTIHVLGDTAADTSADTADTAGDTADTGAEPPPPCGCAAAPSALSALPAAALALALRRRRASAG